MNYDDILFEIRDDVAWVTINRPGCRNAFREQTLDELYASWQHGMELLANIWGTEESLEGMHAFMEKRKPDFQKFRRQNKRLVDEYLEGVARGENQKR